MNIQNLHRNGQWHTPFLPCWQPADGPHPRKRPRVLCFEALLALMMLLILACAAVQDPSTRWQVSGMDPALEGKWKEVKRKKGEQEQEGKDVFNFFKQKGGYYTFEESAKDSMAARTFVFQKQHFMLTIKGEVAKDGFQKSKPEDRAGFVWLYEIKDDTLYLRFLDDKVLNQAINAGKIKGEMQKEHDAEPSEGELDILTSLPRINTLDDATCAALAELAKDDKAWKEVTQFKRVKENKAQVGKPAK